MKSRRQWMTEALTATGEALEMEQRPGVIAPLAEAIKHLELAMALELEPPETPKPVSHQHRRE